MGKFTRLTATACPLDFTNLNTDQLLPARYLKWPRSAGIGKVLLQDLRFDSDGRERPDFPLNRPAWRGAKIIVGGRDFGCGSAPRAAPQRASGFRLPRGVGPAARGTVFGAGLPVTLVAPSSCRRHGGEN